MKKKEILYEMVANHIKEDILNGTYPLGGLIPSEPELEKQYNVSKITVRTAIEGLVTEGYLEKRSGVGTKRNFFSFEFRGAIYKKARPFSSGVLF